MNAALLHVGITSRPEFYFTLVLALFNAIHVGLAIYAIFAGATAMRHKLRKYFIFIDNHYLLSAILLIYAFAFTQMEHWEQPAFALVILTFIGTLVQERIVRHGFFDVSHMLRT